MTRTPRDVAALALLALAPFASADDRFLLIDRELRPSVVNISSIGPAGARFTADDGSAQVMPLADIIALAPEWWRPGTEGSELVWSAKPAALSPRANRPTPGGQGMILLTDGRRLAGRLVPEGDADNVVWDHPRLGRSVFPLDDVRRIHVNPIAGGQPARGGDAGVTDANDRVLMTNGDAVSGFVESVGAVVKIESGGRGETVDLAVKQIAVIELSNPAKPPTGTRLWLSDASVLGAKSLAPPANSGEVRVVRPTLTDDSAQLTVAVADIVALLPDAARVVPLAALPIESQQGVGNRLYAEPVAMRWRGGPIGAAHARETIAAPDRLPPLDAPDIELPGPMRVEWALPAGAARLAGWAEVPGESRLWAEFTLIFEGVSAAGVATPLATESLSGTRPVVEFNIAVPTPAPARLRVTLEPGARGPIQDRAILRRTLVLIDAPVR